MILTDYFLCEHDLTWDYAKQCGVNHGVIRLPDDGNFDFTNQQHWNTVCDKFESFGIKPIVLEPIPNSLHNHIKAGDEKRDESIEKLIKMFPIMQSHGINTICFNFMAHIGWLRTSSNIVERGNAEVTGFNIKDFKPTGAQISADELWNNYSYFIKAVIPYAEKYGIHMALHPDDPPLERLGGVSRIMTSYNNIKRAMDTVKSDMLGVTMCQATYYMMGEDLFSVINELQDKIFFIHFRNAHGTKNHFRETFHDNGDLDMAKLIHLYNSLSLNVPIRVDHVPLMAGESNNTPGYTSLGRLFAIGYLKGLIDGDRL